MRPFERHRFQLPLAPVLLACLTAAGCGDDELQRADLIGTFRAVRFDVLKNGVTDVLAAGGELQITLAADGTTTGRAFVPAGVPGLAEGTEDLEISLEGNWMLLPVPDKRLLFGQAEDTFFRDLVVRAAGSRDMVVLSASGSFNDFKIDMTLRKL